MCMKRDTNRTGTCTKKERTACSSAAVGQQQRLHSYSSSRWRFEKEHRYRRSLMIILCIHYSHPPRQCGTWRMHRLGRRRKKKRGSRRGRGERISHSMPLIPWGVPGRLGFCSVWRGFKSDLKMIECCNTVRSDGTTRRLLFCCSCSVATTAR